MAHSISLVLTEFIAHEVITMFNGFQNKNSITPCGYPD